MGAAESLFGSKSMISERVTVGIVTLMKRGTMTSTAEQTITSSLGTKSRLINNQRIKALLDEWRDALVSGSVFTDYRWQEWDHVDQFDPDRSVSATRNYFKKNGYHLRTLGEFTHEDLALVDMDPAIVLSSADMDARRQRSDLLVGERWRALKDSRRSGHHPLQWQAKRQLNRLGKTTGNFTEIAGDPVAIAYRQTLVSIWFCARLLFISNRGSVVTPNTYPIYPSPHTPEPSSVSLTIEEIQMLHREISFALALEAGQAGAEGEGAGQKRAKRASKRQGPERWEELASWYQQIWKSVGMFRYSRIYTTFTFNYSKARLSKYKGRGSSNGNKAWTKRALAMLRDIMPDEVFSFAVERDEHGRWHIHGIVYGLHQEDFEERYEAAFLQAGGNYTPEAKKYQLDVQGGYGFNGRLGWMDYATKAGGIWYEPHALTHAGVNFYNDVCQLWEDLSEQLEQHGLQHTHHNR